MKISVKYGELHQIFENSDSVTIGSGASCNFVIPTFSEDELVKMIYTPKYDSYILVNTSQNKNLLCNGKPFSKILIRSDFELFSPLFVDKIEVSLLEDEKVKEIQAQPEIMPTLQPSAIGTAMPKKQEQTMQTSVNTNDLFDSDIEKKRISIIKEIGFKISEFKSNIKTANITNFILSSVMGILSVISSFAITNYLLGLQIDSSTSTINLTTNFWFLAGATVVILAVCLALKYSVSSVVNFNSAARNYGTNVTAQKCIIGICLIFLFVVYVLNLCYYKAISSFTAFFISLLFVGGLAVVTIGSGYFHAQIKILKQHLDAYEYREDFESTMKSYRGLINTYINKLSPNKINNVRSNLVNNQMKMVLEFIIGLLTAPFLAYGVSNTLASCFPEAANWVRISGLRFSPIFLVLATFLIVFAFLSFVRAFTIGKQIKGSEIIKFDGFHDYNNHGITILGLDAMRSLEKEKAFVMFVASFIILIEFTMNVSYFVTEIGGSLQGMFLSFMTALVPTALLIAETHMLSATMFKIHNLSELLENLD